MVPSDTPHMFRAKVTVMQLPPTNSRDPMARRWRPNLRGRRTEVVRGLKLGYFWGVVQLIVKPTMTKQKNKPFVT